MNVQSDLSLVGTNYTPDIALFEKLGKKAGVKPASGDSKRSLLIKVDPQRDFVNDRPLGALAVEGAVGDMQRLATVIEEKPDRFTTLADSMDDHVEDPDKQWMIFYAEWWKDMATGKHPDPFTPIFYADIVKGRWVALVDPVWSVRYVDLLEKTGQLNHMIWPHHCSRNSDGQKLVPAIAEAIAFHSAARGATPITIAKGQNRRVEHFGIFGAQVPDPRDPSTQLNVKVLDLIAGYDTIYVAGEAKSHCVLKTMQQMVGYFGNQPDVIKKIRFIMDCTSSVKSPVIDFETLAMDELRKMEKLGVSLITTDDIK